MSDDSPSFPPVESPHPEGETDSGRGVRVESLHGAQQGPDDAHSLRQTDSPCVALCSTLYDDICRGCGRTVLEVANWVFLDEVEKAEIWQRIRAQGFPRR